ncbi:MAG: hypothetical protein ACRDKI_03050 [Solirubrobacterales bacterium]
MRTDVRALPPRVAAVSVGVLWGRKHREPQPELLPVSEVGVAIVDCDNDEPVVERRYLLEGADLALVSEHLCDLDLPVVGFNLLGFDWIALEGVCDASRLIERTIDVRSALLPSVADIVAAEGQSEFPMHGEYGVLNPRRLAEVNLGFVPGDGDDPGGDAELAAALWHEFATSGRAVIAGHTYALEDIQLALLQGERPEHASVESWRSMVAARPQPKAYRKRTRHQVTFPRIDQRYV